MGTAAVEGGTRQAEAAAQGTIALILRLEKGPALQLRPQPLQTFDRGARHEGRDQVPAVATPALEPILHQVRGFGGGPYENAVSGGAGLGLVQLADGHPGLPAEVDQLVIGALEGVALRERRLPRPAERRAREVAERPR